MYRFIGKLVVSGALLAAGVAMFAWLFAQPKQWWTGLPLFVDVVGQIGLAVYILGATAALLGVVALWVFDGK